MAPPAPRCGPAWTVITHGCHHLGIASPSHETARSWRYFSAAWETCWAKFGLSVSTMKLSLCWLAPIDTSSRLANSAARRTAVGQTALVTGASMLFLASLRIASVRIVGQEKSNPPRQNGQAQFARTLPVLAWRWWFSRRVHAAIR